MAATTDHNALAEAAAKALRVLVRPRLVAALCVVVLAVAGWVYLGFMVAGAARAGHAAMLGPGMTLLDWFAGSDPVGRALLDALCRPTFGTPEVSHGATGAAGDLALTLAMWCAMALAMMIPTAAPMIMSYANIAEAAQFRGERTASPVLVAAGYVSVWIGFAVGASLLQWLLTRAALLDPAMASASGLFSGAVFLGAGVYQFSALKQACVTLCQRPDAFFFANWTVAAGGAFRLGLRQGRYCLGCCWALMLVMFAVGTMNVVWMSLLGAIMAVEKIAMTTRFSRITGVAFMAIGVGFMAAAIAAHWPAAPTQ